ncbi:short-chain dehydrogenase/reductase SDR [Haloterrigena turkmenica DSM 5511]|uniref:Short-chain dehydrogenase/reductase SDR n=1 Tax=Haloterrigena turkmenica (strain ATCC 51198 / DSM 5511 / JCM 9101 / NCIMB 13204 / VKM B-1734 / 4k) TaxID=543526 RepID=D2RUP7_HALTV|nr:SDR family NAD(P)-dependent oxidoreductase [Haloterrigena turkmenica]ADB61219.1 short-chain dehydrogenase/reductase SDR [Haloterrigena turkmenica DSM 5511]
MTTAQFSLEGQTAVVTGSSSGIGKAMVERFADDGANVVVTSRELENVEPVAEAINESEADGQALAVECDVTDREAVDELIARTVDVFGGLDTLVNNAGASFQAPPAEISENGWKTIVDINLHGTFHCSQAAGAYMREHDGGKIINVASVAGQRGSRQMSHYGAAKAGVINFTKSVAADWAEDDVWVNCIAPGLVATEGVKSQMGVDDDADAIDRTTADRTIGTPEEVADLAQFLASPASSYIVGETITITGTPRLE